MYCKKDGFEYDSHNESEVLNLNIHGITLLSFKDIIFIFVPKKCYFSSISIQFHI